MTSLVPLRRSLSLPPVVSGLSHILISFFLHHRRARQRRRRSISSAQSIWWYTHESRTLGALARIAKSSDLHLTSSHPTQARGPQPGTPLTPRSYHTTAHNHELPPLQLLLLPHRHQHWSVQSPYPLTPVPVLCRQHPQHHQLS